MILYFTGMGNSRYAARILSEVTGDELMSLNLRLKRGGSGPIRSEAPFVFAVSTYAWPGFLFFREVSAPWIIAGSGAALPGIFYYIYKSLRLKKGLI